MDYVLRILHKHLRNEREWLRLESLGKADARYREGARMAKERLPQLEKAIELLIQSERPQSPKVNKTQTPRTSRLTDFPTIKTQLNLFP